MARTPSGKLGPMRDEESMADERAEVTILPVIDMHTASTTADPAYVVASANATTVADMVRRASDVAFGLIGIAVADVARTQAATPATPPPRPGVLRLFSDAAVGVTVAARNIAVEGIAAVESTLHTVGAVVTSPPVVRRRVDAIEDAVERWRATNGVQQQQNEEAARAFVRDLAPRIATAVLTEIDLKTIIAAVPMDDIISELDINGIVANVDINGIVNQVDIDGIISRVDIDGIISRVDIDGIVGRVDIDGLMANIDIDALMGRVDVGALLDTVDMRAIVRESTGSVGSELVDSARISAVRLDLLVNKIVDKILLRRKPRKVELKRVPSPEDSDDDMTVEINV
jgi:hypothetical protein